MPPAILAASFELLVFFEQKNIAIHICSAFDSCHCFNRNMQYPVLHYKTYAGACIAAIFVL